MAKGTQKMRREEPHTGPIIDHGHLNAHPTICFPSHLKVKHDLAHEAAQEPSFSYIPQHSRRETDENDQEVGHGQIDDEIVGDSAHGVVAIDGETDQAVAHQTHDEHGDVEADEGPLVGRRVDVVLDHGQVVLV